MVCVMCVWGGGSALWCCSHSQVRGGDAVGDMGCMYSCMPVRVQMQNWLCVDCVLTHGVFGMGGTGWPCGVCVWGGGVWHNVG